MAVHLVWQKVMNANDVNRYSAIVPMIDEKRKFFRPQPRRRTRSPR
jgi:hypothetical protein